MNDFAQPASLGAVERTTVGDVEPVNPYSLLEAVNDSSDTAHTGWLIFLGFMAYLLVAVAGVTHKDLLLSSDLALPILQVKIDITRFFLFGPILLVLFHIGMVSQLVMMARKALELDRAIRAMEPGRERNHPLRLQLHNFFFVQAIAGPERSRVLSVFLHGMSWLTLVILPVLLILYVQVAFLPYHDVTTTWAHRIALVADVVTLLLIGVFLTRREATYASAFARMSRRHPVTFAITSAVLLLVSFFSLFVATIPGEALDRAAQSLPGARGGQAKREDGYAIGFVVPFFGASMDGSLFGLFQRNLNVADLDLVVDKDVTGDEASLNLRGRDLRFARLDRTDLHQADLTGADLEGASLAGADLRKVTMGCADINTLLLTENRQEARCTHARRADMRRARLVEARMAGIDLRGARLDEAMLEGADLKYAVMTGASFYAAHLERADMTGGAVMQGVNLGAAQLAGADLTGAKLTGADLRHAHMHGTILAFAELYGAQLAGADLESADLGRARLQGASLTGTTLRAADLRGAGIWSTAPTTPALVTLADLGALALAPLDDGEVAELNGALQRIESLTVRAQVREALGPLLVVSDARKWAGSADQAAWQAQAAFGTGEGYKGRLTDFLVRTACKSRWASGAVATGVARRALRPEFNGDMASVYERLKAADCQGGRTVMERRVGRDLAAAADNARGN